MSLETTGSPLCGGFGHFSRRGLLKATALGGSAWLTGVAQQLARASEKAPSGAPARSVIVVWLGGGPSQFDTFDPKPGTKYGGGVEARKTASADISIAKGFEQLADQMHHISLVRSVMSKEGDHERATYTLKTGYRPDPTVIHPAIGAILCHETTDAIDIPRHVSILPDQWSARGGYLGDKYDAFRVPDPVNDVPDVTSLMAKNEPERYNRRFADLDVVEKQFARRRRPSLEKDRTLHRATVDAARRMMTSEQLAAFNVNTATEEERKEFGDTNFGRGCLTALRLIECGVRCVEVTMSAWDTHANNEEYCKENIAILDPSYAALIRQLEARKLLDHTIVICCGEFGRTPTINPLGGRDHWPHGFTVALAGGGIRGGRVIGETSAEVDVDDKDREKYVRDPRHVDDIHATVLKSLGIDYSTEIMTPIQRPLAYSTGKPIQELLD